MPTLRVEPLSDAHLGDVADALLKARKVVVVTGAGISTNSGIPDFRSENGLYSLIQAQFDAAARQARLAEAAHGPADASADGRHAKRLKTSPHPPLPTPAREHMGQGATEAPAVTEAIEAQSMALQLAALPLPADDGPPRQACFTTPRPKTATLATVQLTTSPLSSPPPDDCILPPCLSTHAHRRLVNVALPLSSSPLSSPPPVLFDPFAPSSPSDTSSDRRSSASSPDLDDGAPSSWNPSNSSSQASSSGRGTLPFIKGKDLFDASIWADPIRTSVFYTFATSLRQKIKEAEPTSSHHFISHLRDRGKLVRCYTQNIDQIEEKVGLSTCLDDGPGSRARFSRRSTANASQLGKMVDESSMPGNEPAPADKSSQPEPEPVQQFQEPPPSDGSGGGTPALDGDVPVAEQVKPQSQSQKPRSGVECVFLHGSLELLRCFLCGKLCSWDDDERESQTLAGQQPECPHCVGATVARQERGKRRLGVGKLRPDIVLYGEDNPKTPLIHPIVTHDLALYPDMLLILGTSLRVHGLKVMVREFAKAVHSKGGKVVFVNLTKPPESSWGDVIDYWVQWDCDAWVADLQGRIPTLWQEPQPRRPRKKRESSEAKEDKKANAPAHPAALRDTKVAGAYWSFKVVQELHRITGASLPARRASVAAPPTTGQGESVDVDNAKPPEAAAKPKARRPRKSAPGALEKPKRTCSTLNPNHGRATKRAAAAAAAALATEAAPRAPATEAPQMLAAAPALSVQGQTSTSSVLNSVKENPRIRRRRKIDGQEVPAPFVGRRRNGGSSQAAAAKATKAAKAAVPLGLKLPPIASPPMREAPTSPYGRPQPLEPRSPPAGPLATLSPNLRSAHVFQRASAFYLEDPWVHLLDSAPQWSPLWRAAEDRPPLRFGNAGGDAALTLAASPVLTGAAPAWWPREHERGRQRGQQQEYEHGYEREWEQQQHREREQQQHREREQQQHREREQPHRERERERQQEQYVDLERWGTSWR